MVNCLEQIKKKILKFEYVSFDVYDTLVFRSVKSPKDVPYMVASIFKTRYGKTLFSFPVNRQYAEAAAKKKLKREVLLDDIYAQMPYNKNTNELLKSIEIECEIGLAMPNVIMCDLLKWCVTNEKRIIITSDMYLPNSVMASILAKFHLPYEKLYVSSEVNATKREGKLFEYVLNDLNVPPHKIVHLGDNEVNDIEMPLRYGISSVHCLDKRIFNNFPTYTFEKSVESQHLLEMYRVSCSNKMSLSPAFRIGYNGIGPMLYAFCEWLHIQKKNLGIQKLLFCSREGYFIKRVYECMYPEQKNDCVYVRLNTNLLRLPAQYKTINLSTLIASFPAGKDSFLLNDIVELLLFDDIEKTLGKCYEKFPSLTREVAISKKEMELGKYDALLLFLLDLSKEQIQKQAQYLIEYLDFIGISKYRVGLVNNSGRGSSQKILESFSRDNGIWCDIIGLQFDSIYRNVSEAGYEYRSFFDYLQIFPPQAKLLFGAFGLVFEHLLFEPCGTSRSFYRNQENQLCVHCDNLIQETQNFSTVSDIQEAALEFISDNNLSIKIDIAQSAIFSIMSMFTHPQKEDAVLLGNLWDEDYDGYRQINPKDDLKSVSIFNSSKNKKIIWIQGALAIKGKYILLDIYHYKRVLSRFIHYKYKNDMIHAIIKHEFIELRDLFCATWIRNYKKLTNAIKIRYFTIRA